MTCATCKHALLRDAGTPEGYTACRWQEAYVYRVACNINLHEAA